MMNKKHYEELLKVKSGEHYTKSNNFWSPLVRSDIVSVERFPGPDCKIKEVSLTAFGKVVLAREVR